MAFIVVYRKLNLFLLCIGSFLFNKKSGRFECKARFSISTFACLIIYLIILIAIKVSDVPHLHAHFYPTIVNLLLHVLLIVLLSIGHRYKTHHAKFHFSSIIESNTCEEYSFQTPSCIFFQLAARFENCNVHLMQCCDILHDAPASTYGCSPQLPRRSSIFYRFHRIMELYEALYGVQKRSHLTLHQHLRYVYCNI